MVAGNKYTFNVTGTMDGSQITWSKDNALNSYSTFEEDGTTPAIGTDYNGITKITVDFDGAKCSIVSLDKIVDDIEARVTVNEGNISTNTANILTNTQQRAIMGGGVLINSLLNVNQFGVSGTVILLAGELGHDRMIAGAGGATYTFASLEDVTTITISAGTLIQNVLGENILTGDYIFTWDGTSQAQIDGGGFAVSPILTTLTGGTNAVCEWGTGTLTKLRLIPGTIDVDYIKKPFADELWDCQYFGWAGESPGKATAFKFGLNDANLYLGAEIQFPREMFEIPTTSSSGGTFTNCTDADLGTTTVRGFEHRVTVDSDGAYRAFGVDYVAKTSL
jgi:hypothetical protein